MKITREWVDIPDELLLEIHCTSAVKVHSLLGKGLDHSEKHPKLKHYTISIQKTFRVLISTRNSQNNKMKSWGGPMSQQTGFYEYGVSPYQLKLFKGFFNPGLTKLAKKIGRQSLFIGPPAALFYVLTSYAESKYEYYSRKAYLNSPENHGH